MKKHFIWILVSIALFIPACWAFSETNDLATWVYKLLAAAMLVCCFLASWHVCKLVSCLKKKTSGESVSSKLSAALAAFFIINILIIGLYSCKIFINR